MSLAFAIGQKTFCEFYSIMIWVSSSIVNTKDLEMQFNLYIAFIVAVTFFSLNPAANASCGGAFCSLNTDSGVQGSWLKPGFRLDIHTEFIDLDQLRHGTENVAPAGKVGEHDEMRTLNRNIVSTLNRNIVSTLDWNINQDWGLTLYVPFVNRAHQHVFNAVDVLGVQNLKLKMGFFWFV